jgi:hypothetical protein
VLRWPLRDRADPSRRCGKNSRIDADARRRLRNFQVLERAMRLIRIAPAVRYLAANFGKCVRYSVVVNVKCVISDAMSRIILNNLHTSRVFCGHMVPLEIINVFKKQ